MSIHFTLSLYWLLLPLAVGLLWWATYERADERATGFMPDLGPLFRLVAAVVIFLLAVCALLALNLFLK